MCAALATGIPLPAAGQGLLPCRFVEETRAVVTAEGGHRILEGLAPEVTVSETGDDGLVLGLQLGPDSPETAIHDVSFARVGRGWGSPVAVSVDGQDRNKLPSLHLPNLPTTRRAFPDLLRAHGSSCGGSFRAGAAVPGTSHRKHR